MTDNPNNTVPTAPTATSDDRAASTAFVHAVVTAAGGITGPGSSTSGDIATFNGTTGQVIQDSGVLASSVVTGPASVTSGDLASFNGTTGKIVQDSGVLANSVVTGPASVTSGHVASYNGTTGKIIQDGGALPAGAIVGTTDSQTLTNKTIAGGSNTISAIANASLTNSSITIAGASTALGGSYAPVRFHSSQSSNPTSTTSTSGVMAGLGSSAFGTSAAITPATSGNILFIISGFGNNGTAGDGGKLIPYYGTGTAPSNGASATGTPSGSAAFVQIAADVSGAAGFSAPFSIQFYVTGLTLSTTYWFDLLQAALTGGTFAIGGIRCTAIEL